MIKLGSKRVYLACGATDMRRSIDGLSALVKYSFKLDLFDGAVFVFCNRGRDKLKILDWDGNGFWLHYKRLEKGRFPWPRRNDRHTMELSAQELEQLLDGTKLIQKINGQEISIAVI
jgi:transposase